MITQCFFVFSPLWLDEMQRYITAFTSHTQNSKSQFRIWSLRTEYQYLIMAQTDMILSKDSKGFQWIPMDF